MTFQLYMHVCVVKLFSFGEVTVTFTKTKIC